MADEKIKVSWDEVNSQEVDVKIKQNAALGQAQEHYRQQQVGPPPFGPSPTGFSDGPPMARPRTSIWYNTLFYMAFFGIVGGVLAWGAGEIVMIVVPDPREQFDEFRREASEVLELAKKGEITEARAEARLDDLKTKYANNPYVKLFTDDSLSESEGERLVKEQAEKDTWREYWHQLIWFSSLGIILACALSVADHLVGRNWPSAVVNGSVGVVLGLIGGLVVGLFINKLYSAMGGGQEEAFAKQMFARTIGWGILGLFLAIAPGVVLRDWKRLGIGLAGGLLGGLVGGLLFDPVALWTHNGVVSRFVAIAAIGLVAGLGTGLIEKAAKSGWLRVVAGLIAGKQFVIYKNPTYIGSSPQCEIYLFKDTRVGPRHAAIHLLQGGYEIEDLQSPSGTFVNGRPVSRARLRNNDQVQIGATAFQFQEKARSTQ